MPLVDVHSLGLMSPQHGLLSSADKCKLASGVYRVMARLATVILTALPNVSFLRSRSRFPLRLSFLSAPKQFVLPAGAFPKLNCNTRVLFEVLRSTKKQLPFLVLLEYCQASLYQSR
jgi:hypothetical protein